MSKTIFVAIIVTLLSIVFSPFISANTNMKWNTEDYARIVGDFNGDNHNDYLYQSRIEGKTNILQISHIVDEIEGKEVIEFSTLAVKSNYSQIPFTKLHRLLIAGDYNGDGYDDVLAFKRDDFEGNIGEAGYLFLGAEYGIDFENAHQILDSNQLVFLKNVSLFNYKTADFNNDGKLDLLAIPSYQDNDGDGVVDKVPSDKFYLVLAEEQGHLSKVHQSINPGQNAWASSFKQILVGDFNYDGRADLFIQGRDSSNQHRLIYTDNNNKISIQNAIEYAADFDDGQWHGQASRLELGHFISKDELHIRKIPEETSSDDNTNIKLLEPSSGTITQTALTEPELDFPPNPPDPVIAPATDDDGVFAVSWTRSTLSDGFELEQQLETGAWVQIYSGNEISYTVTVSTNGNYQYRARAWRAIYYSDWAYSSSVAVTITPPPVIPGAPVITINPLTVYDNEVFQVSWTAPSDDITDYHLISTVGDDYLGNFLYTYEALPVGAHTYRVRAKNAAGWGPFSDIVNVTVVARPTVSITSPTSLETFKVNEKVIVNVNTVGYAPSGMTIAYQLDNGPTIIRKTSTSHDYGILPAGNHNVTVWGEYPERYSGTIVNTLTKVVSFTVNTNSVPLITPVLPSQNTIFKTTDDVIATATASDSDGSVVQVEFRLDSVTGSEPWDITTSTYLKNYGKLSSGDHKVEYRSLDDMSSYSVTKPINITVNTKPTIIPLFPTNNYMYLTTDAIVASADVLDDESGAQVEFRLDGGAWKLGNASNIHNFGYPGSGSHTIEFRALDNRGEYSELPYQLHQFKVNSLPTGSVVINGIVEVGQSLTASNTLADVDGIGTISYIWKRGATTAGSGSTYVVSSSDVGSTLTVTASYIDGGGTSETKTSAPTPVVPPENVPPVITQGVSITITVTEDVAKSFTLNATDVDSSPLTWSQVGIIQSHGVITGLPGNGTSKTITYTPGTNNTTATSFQVKVDDNEGGTDIITVNVSMDPVNDPPTISNISNQTIDEEGTAGPISFTINDIETPAASLGLVGTSSDPTLVPNGNIVFGGSGSNRTVTVTPLMDQSGTTTITVTVSDGTDSTIETFLLTVNPDNDDPTGDVTIIGIPNVGNTLTVSNTMADVDGIGTIGYTWKRGATTVGTGSTYVVTSLDKGLAITVTASYTDGGGTLESKTSSPVYPPVNNPPVITQGTSITITVTKDVAKSFILNATDSDSSTLTWSQHSAPTYGSITGLGDGFSRTITYTPNAGNTTDDSFEVMVDDKEGGTDIITVNVTMTTLEPPTANAGTDQSVDEGVTVTLSGSGDDSDGTIVSYKWVQLTGTAVTIADSSSAITSFTAPDVSTPTDLIFQLTVTDNDGLTATDSIVVTVNNNNVPPVITEGGSITITVTKDVAKSFTLNATDSDSDPLTWSVVQGSEPTYGNITGLGDGFTKTITYTPNAGNTTDDSFEVMIDDGDGGSDIIIINVTMTTLEPPTANAGLDQSVNEGVTVTPIPPQTR